MITSTNFKIGDEVHITNSRLPNAMTVKVYEYNTKAVVDVPNILLQTTYPIIAFRYVNNGKSGYTIEKCEFKINQKPKPDDYVYTETEILTWEALDKRIEALERGGGTGGTVDPEYIEELVDEYLAENPPPPGEKGEKGDKGDPGEPGKDGKDGSGVGVLNVTIDFDTMKASHTAGEIYAHKQNGGTAYCDGVAFTSITEEYASIALVAPLTDAESGAILCVQTNTLEIDATGSVSITSAEVPGMDDGKTTDFSTWSSQKIAEELESNIGSIETALDAIIDIQNSLIGGGSV